MPPEVAKVSLENSFLLLCTPVSANGHTISLSQQAEQPVNTNVPSKANRRKQSKKCKSAFNSMQVVMHYYSTLNSA